MHLITKPLRAVVASCMVLIAVGSPAGRSAGRPAVDLAVGLETALTESGDDYREPHLAIHPTRAHHFVVAAMKKASASAATTDIFLSADGGTTWKPSAITDLKQATHVADPWFAFGPGESLFYSVLATIPQGAKAQDRMGVRVYRSLDAGHSWTGPAHVPFAAPGSYDKPSLAVDTGRRPADAAVYIATQQRWMETDGS
jgi:hypothetical protein